MNTSSNTTMASISFPGGANGVVRRVGGRQRLAADDVNARRRSRASRSTLSPPASRLGRGAVRQNSSLAWAPASSLPLPTARWMPSGRRVHYPQGLLCWTPGGWVCKGAREIVSRILAVVLTAEYFIKVVGKRGRRRPGSACLTRLAYIIEPAHVPSPDAGVNGRDASGPAHSGYSGTSAAGAPDSSTDRVGDRQAHPLTRGWRWHWSATPVRRVVAGSRPARPLRARPAIAGWVVTSSTRWPISTRGASWP